MASKPSSFFDLSDRNLARLRKMCEVVCKRALHDVLRWLNPKWMPSMSFKDYLKSELNVSMRLFNSALKPHQKRALRNDPQGSTYDISLLYILILWGNEGLADKDDEVWQKKSGCLEFLVTAVKNVRNDLMHTYQPIDITEFYLRAEILRELLRDMFEAARTRFIHIKQEEVNQTVLDMDTLINRIRDDPLDPKDFAEYKRQLMFPQQCDFAKDKGAMQLRMRHMKYSSLTPVSRLAKVKFLVDDIFTDIVLEGGCGKKDKLDLQCLLEADDKSLTCKSILVEGDAGMGKTTLTKKLLSDWVAKKRDINYVDHYDLVMHVECRDHVKSFKGLLDSSMTEVSKTFSGEDLVYVTLSLNCLIIVDGIDELNKQSTLLFKDILQLKRDYDITVLVTSRPEAVEKYFQLVTSRQIETKHIKLLGIPQEKIEEFVTKYYDGIEKTGRDCQGIEGLLKYLKRTEYRLGYLWKSPYNLSILTILWTMAPDSVNSITTAPELHWEIHQLSVIKLRERLLNSEVTQYLPSSLLDTKIDHFIYNLCQESLVALANDDVTLPEVAYQRLVKTCLNLELPVEEMVGAFLKRTSTVLGTRYSFPHKGLQDFLAAHFIWLRLTATVLSSDIQRVLKDFNDSMTKNSVPLHVNRNIMSFAEEELVCESSQNTHQQAQDCDAKMSKMIMESLHRINNIPDDLIQDISKLVDQRLGSSDQPSSFSLARKPKRERGIIHIIIDETSQLGLLPEMAKFQNMFTALLGIFYMDKSNRIKEETKMEVLELLQKTGVRDKDAWLNILNSVRCDRFVASFISEQPNIFEGEILITDSTLFAYISLMQSLNPSLQDISNVCIDLDIKGDLTGADELLNVISIHQYKVNRILVNDNNFTEYAFLLQLLTVPLRDSHEVNIDLHVNEDLLKIFKFMAEIKRHGFVVKTLQMKDCHVDDSNLPDYIMMLRSLPLLLKDANQTNIDLYVRGDLDGAEDLLQLISVNQFKVKTVVVSDNNISQYVIQLQSLIVPLKEPHEVSFEIHLYQEPLIIDLLHQIRQSEFFIKDLRMRDILINDDNLWKYITMFKSLPPLLKDNNNTSIDIDIRGDLCGAEELLDLVSICHFKVRKIAISDKNFMAYTSLLKSLKMPLRDAHDVNIDVHVDEDLANVCQLMEEIKRNCFIVRKLQVKDFQIDDSNYGGYISILQKLPVLSKDANRVSVDLNINGSLAGSEESIELINLHQFRVETVLITNQNCAEYITLLKTLRTHFRNPSEVKINLAMTDDLTSVSELLQMIDILQFKIKRILITDDNVKNYTALLKTLKTPFRDSDQVGIDLAIRRELSGTDELLEQVSIHQFQVERIGINNQNFDSYASLLKTLQHPLRNPHKVNIDLDIYGRLLEAQELLEQTQKYKFTIRKLTSWDINIYDHNVLSCISLLKTLPRLPKNSVQTCIYILLQDLTYAEELLRLVGSHNFTQKRIFINDENINKYTVKLENVATPLIENHNIGVELEIVNGIQDSYGFLNLLYLHKFSIRRILINDNNYAAYTTLLRGLKTPIGEAHEVNFEVELQYVTLFEVKNLLVEIAAKNFQIKKLSVGGDQYKINDDNISEYVTVLSSLPLLPSDKMIRNFDLEFQGESIGVRHILTEISRNYFSTNIALFHDFKYPTSQLPIKDAINSVFERCQILQYRGALVQGMVIPNGLRFLYASIADSGGYSTLLEFLNADLFLIFLDVCVSHTLEASSSIKPLPGRLENGPPSLIITDVGESSIENAAALAKRFQPSSGRVRFFQGMAFPRTTLSTQGIKNLLRLLQGVTSRIVIFPSRCKPASQDDEDELNSLVCPLAGSITWGECGYCHINIDDW